MAACLEKVYLIVFAFALIIAYDEFRNYSDKVMIGWTTALITDEDDDVCCRCKPEYPRIYGLDGCTDCDAEQQSIDSSLIEAYAMQFKSAEFAFAEGHALCADERKLGSYGALYRDHFCNQLRLEEDAWNWYGTCPAPWIPAERYVRSVCD